MHFQQQQVAKEQDRIPTSTLADLQMISFIDDTIEHNGKRKPNEEEFCRDVEEKFTPYVGQEFLKIEEAVTFYKIYAVACGFDVWKYMTKRWRGGEIKSKLLICNREGFAHKGEMECIGRQDSSRRHKVRRVGWKARIRLFIRNDELLIDRFHNGHNHELISGRDREFQKLSCNITDYHKMIILYNSRLKIGATKTYKIIKEHVNGFENIGANLNDFKKLHRDVKCYIHERYDQMFVDHFKEMAVNRQGFFFDYDVDSDGSLSKAIWADSIARRSYSVFGDAVSFDPTYSTNKYDMAFTPFTGVDHHR
ncbi:protein FAR1-RELATED SEQUENCE 5-like [Silene latifolia]|uniref:protein FAR1-RELATED SEQUENCE 5-like n=1 Tax=Silene latifolia TaxID=37657 RepID=UPI003D78A65C